MLNQTATTGYFISDWHIAANEEKLKTEGLTSMENSKLRSLVLRKGEKKEEDWFSVRFIIE
jgi:hypothetical protein